MSKFVKVLVKKSKEIVKMNRKQKGSINLEMCIIIAILLIVCFPLYKDIATSTWTSIKAWFSTSTSNIFKTVPAISGIFINKGF